MTGLVADPGRVTELAKSIAEGTLSSVALVERYLNRIADVDARVNAWRYVDGERALAIARIHDAEARAGRLRGPLHGIPFAVKDNTDVEGLTTLCNSRSLANVRPADADASVVLALRAAGAIPLGKVHTTEFTYFDPSPACNPHNLGHTPGGSSSGSAAAVAAGMAPFAIGTQTIASVNRPAAYCGIGAFKPSTGTTSPVGVWPLAPVFDTVGYFGYTLEDAVAVYEAVRPDFIAPGPLQFATQQIFIFEDAHLEDAQPEVTGATNRLAGEFERAGYKISRRKSPASLKRIYELQQLMMHYETGRVLRHLQSAPQGSVGERILAAIGRGGAITTDAYVEAHNEMSRLRAVTLEVIGDGAVLQPATPAPAPEGLASTGDPRYIAPWTAIGGPIASIPAGATSNGLPLGCILTTRPGTDARLSVIAKALAPIARRVVS